MHDVNYVAAEIVKHSSKRLILDLQFFYTNHYDLFLYLQFIYFSVLRFQKQNLKYLMQINPSHIAEIVETCGLRETL